MINNTEAPILCLMGYSGTGKTTIAKKLRDLSAKDGLYEKIIDVSDIVKKYSFDGGTDAMQNKNVKKVLLDEIIPGCIVCGLREEWLYQAIKEEYKHIYIFYLECSERIRFERMRGEYSISQMIKKDQKERQIGLTNLIYNHLNDSTTQIISTEHEDVHGCASKIWFHDRTDMGTYRRIGERNKEDQK